MPAGMGRQPEESDIVRQILCVIRRDKAAAEIGLHHVDNGIIVAGFKKDIGRKSSLFENIVGKSPHGGIFVQKGSY